jgi:hypothetical protein
MSEPMVPLNHYSEVAKSLKAAEAERDELLAALEKIHEMACYGCEENTAARYEMLLKIGETARAALAKARTEGDKP